MNSRTISESALIDAPPAVAYGIIADYHDRHPRILPRPPFVSLTVERGGTGAGTAIHVEMRVLGRLSAFRADVSEPEPGRVLVETNDNGFITTFTVEPRDEGRRSYVTIATEMTGRDGLFGALERRLVKRILRPVYREELQKLEELATQSASP